MSRTLDHVIYECLDDKLRSKSVRDQILRDYDYYKSCWDSLNKWIESKLKKNKVFVCLLNRICRADSG
jgi:hypothetical protein